MPDNDSAIVKEALERNITAINTRDIEGFLANQQPDVVFTMPGGVTFTGRDQLQAFMEAQWAAFPDGQLAFGAQVLGEDSAATEIVFRGTHTGPLPGPHGTIDPTGRAVTLHSASFLTIRDGLIASERVYADPAELAGQLADGAGSEQTG